MRDHGCHPECYAGIGGDVVCIRDDSTQPSDGPSVYPTQEDYVYKGTNTPTSEDISWYSLSDVPASTPHQMGSTPGGTQPTPPDILYTQNRDEINVGEYTLPVNL